MKIKLPGLHKTDIIILSLLFARLHINVDSSLVRVFLFDGIIVLFIMTRILIQKNFINIFRKPNIIIPVALVCLIAPLSYLSQDFVGYVYNIYRIIYLVIFYIMCNMYLCMREIKISDIGYILYTIFFINLFVVSVQLFQPSGLYEFISFAWGDDKLRGINTGAPRVYGTFMNANWFGVYLAMMLSFIMYQFKNSNENRKLLYIIIIIWAIMIIASGSRTGIISSAIVIIYWVSIASDSKIALASFIIVGAMVAYNIEHILDLEMMYRFAELQQLSSGGEGIQSLDARFQATRDGVDYFMMAPVFGLGETEYSSTFHNSYITILANHGVIGGVLISVIMVTILGYRLLAMPCTHLAIALLLPVVVAFLTGEYIYVTQLMTLLIFVLAALQQYVGD